MTVREKTRRRLDMGEAKSLARDLRPMLPPGQEVKAVRLPSGPLTLLAGDRAYYRDRCGAVMAVRLDKKTGALFERTVAITVGSLN